MPSPLSFFGIKSCPQYNENSSLAIEHTKEKYSYFKTIVQLSPEGEVNSVAIYRDTKHRGIYLALFTDPEEDRCFSIYQISWIKMNKTTFFELKTSRSRNFVYNLQ